MPQNPVSYLTVTDGGTVIHNVSTIVMSGSGVTLSKDNRTANVMIDGGGTGGDGAYVALESGTVSQKMSDMGVLVPGSYGPVYELVVQNGVNLRRPQGYFIQPDNTGSGTGLLVNIKASSATYDGYGAPVYVSGGDAQSKHSGGAYLSSGGSVRYHAQSVYVAGGYSQYAGGGDAQIVGGSSKFGRGSGVNLQGGGSSYSYTHSIYVNSDSALASSSMPFHSGQNPDGWSMFTAKRAMRVVGVIGRLNAASGSTASMTPVKVQSGTAVSDGTALTTNSFDANGSPNANQSLTLVGNVAGFTTLTLTDTPLDGSRVTFGSVTYEFKLTLDDLVDNEVHIGASATTAVANLVSAITGGGTPGVDYSALTKPNLFLTPSAPVGSSVVVTYATPSFASNDLVTTTDVVGGSFTGETMAGGSSTCDLDAGDSIAVQASGSWVLSDGDLTVHMTWL